MLTQLTFAGLAVTACLLIGLVLVRRARGGTSPLVGGDALFGGDAPFGPRTGDVPSRATVVLTVVFLTLAAVASRLSS